MSKKYSFGPDSHTYLNFFLIHFSFYSFGPLQVIQFSRKIIVISDDTKSPKRSEKNNNIKIA